MSPGSLRATESSRLLSIINTFRQLADYGILRPNSKLSRKTTEEVCTGNGQDGHWFLVYFVTCGSLAKPGSFSLLPARKRHSVLRTRAKLCMYTTRLLSQNHKPPSSKSPLEHLNSRSPPDFYSGKAVSAESWASEESLSDWLERLHTKKRVHPKPAQVQDQPWPEKADPCHHHLNPFAHRRTLFRFSYNSFYIQRSSRVVTVPTSGAELLLLLPPFEQGQLLYPSGLLLAPPPSSPP